MRRLPMALSLLPAAALAAMFAPGCAIPHAIGGMAQNWEYQKKIQVLPEYDQLSGHKVAVLVDVNQAMLYEHPFLASQVALGVATAIQQRVTDVRVINPDHTLTWQYRTPNWRLMGYEDMAKVLDVDRIILIEIYEYRLTPPGNRYEWNGACAARVRVVETDERALDPNSPVDEFDVIAKFPDQDGVTWESAGAQQIETGVLTKFIQKTAWLFYEHEEPKYPDKYRPELDRQT